MDYTSFSINEERFGFHTKGSFRCAYENQRLIVIGFIAAMFLLGAGMITILIMAWSIITEMGAPTAAEIADSIVDGANPRLAGHEKEMAIFGTYMMAAAACLILLMLTVMAYLITISILKTGQTYTFEADSKRFRIFPPEKNKPVPEIVIYYDDVINVSCSERRMFSSEHGLDVFISTKQKDIVLQFIHTPRSKLEGLIQTPFNIIMERSGLTSKPDFRI